MTISNKQVLDTFLMRLAGATRANYRCDLGQWQHWLQGRGTDLLNATRQDVEEYLAHRRDNDGIAPRTISTYLGHIRGLYRWALREDLVGADPTLLVKTPPRGRTTRAWLGPTDTVKLLDASLTWREGILAAHVHLWALSGLRPGEPRRLRVEDLGSHDGRPTLAVQATKTPGRERLMLPETTAALLLEAASGRRRGTLLVHPLTGRPWTKAAELKRLHGLLRHAGLPQVTPYGLRTGFITLALEAGIDERLVMISARHASSAQTARYDRMRDQVERAAGPVLSAWLRSTQPTGLMTSDAPA